MIPALTGTGRSFKGAAAYYLHDKIGPDSKGDTAERVAWTHVLNLPTADPERAWRMMTHTALARGVLKSEAGVKASGRKLEKPVLAYSLSWHPDEQPTREEQLAAAKESLLALGLTAHQAIIVCHTDEPHPHVHILVNRVHPMTGKAATLSKSKLALSHWAQAYEERHGRVFCRARVENNARRGGSKPGRAADNRSRRASRPEQAAGGSSRPEAATLRRQHAALFTAQAGQEVQGHRRRSAELQAFRTSRLAGRKAAADRVHHWALIAAHPALAEESGRIAALLAGDRPANALAALTRDRSTFTRSELERFVGRHTPDETSFAAVMLRLDAYALDPEAAHDAALLVHMGDHLDRGLRLWVQERFYEAAPVLRPGPWGLAPAGRRQLDADREASRSPWNRWGEQLGDFKHRLLHPPGPHDVTFPGSGWDDEPPTGPAP